MTRILLQLNLAKMRAPFSDPLFDDFKASLRELHQLAEQSEGFLWRYQGEKSPEGYIQPFPKAPLIMGNMSAWANYKNLYEYTFSGPHLKLMRNKRKWFDRLPIPYAVLYYDYEDALLKPSDDLLEEAKLRLNYLGVYGETPAAFGFGPHNGVL